MGLAHNRGCLTHSLLGWARRPLCGTVRLVVEIKRKVPGTPRTTIKAEGGSGQIWVEVDNAMINRREHRIGMWIAVAAIMLLTMGISGCGGSKPSNPRGTPNGTLNELEKAIRREDIDAMLACYTDPYYVIVGGEVTLASHDIASIAVVHLRRIRSRSCVWPGRGQAGHDARQLTSGGIASATYAFTSCPR